MRATHSSVKAAATSILSNTILTILKLIIGLMMHSVSVIAEAAHSGLDLLAAIVAYFSVKESGKPADDKHRYGHGKIESISGIIEALLIFIAAGYIIHEAIGKLAAGRHEVENLWVGTSVMAFSAIANCFVSNYLYRVAKENDSLALEADALHLRTDVYTSIGVFLGLIAIKLTGKLILDPIIAIVVAIIILKAAYQLIRNALQNLVDVKLPETEEKLIEDVLMEHSEYIVDYHNLRTRKSGPERYIDFHMVVPRSSSLEESHDFSHAVVKEIKRRLPNSRILVHTEPCTDQCARCKVACLESQHKVLKNADVEPVRKILDTGDVRN